MASGATQGCLVLVDAHALIFQVFHAIREPMTGPDGRPTNALFGFTRDLFTLRDSLQPDYLVCAFDCAGPTFRNAIAADYKAHRPPPPDDLQLQVPLIHRVVEAMNLPVLAVPGYEADDVIATVAVAGRDRGLDVVLAATDKDCRQLIGDRVRMYNLRKREYLDRAALLADWGVAPEQVVDFQALVGDSVDNVQGVPGVGPKTAAKLLQEFGTLDNLLANLDKAGKGKVQEKLKEYADKVLVSRQLVRLDANVPVSLDWDNWRVRPWDAPKLLSLFEEFGFRGFAAKVRAAQKVSADAGAGDLFGGATAVDQEAETFNFGFNAPPAAEWVATYDLIDTPKLFARFLKDLKKQKRFAIDLETTDLDPLKADLVGIAICWEAGHAYYLAVRGPEDCPKLDPAATLAALRPVLEDEQVRKINQNVKYDQMVLRKHGVKLAGVVGDPMVADYLLRSGERSHNLDEMARRYLGHENTPITDLIGKKGKNQLRMDQVPTRKVADYAGEDADVAWRLCAMLEQDLATQGLKKLYDDLEIPLIDVLADLEYLGIRLDVPFLNRLGEQMAVRMQTMEKEIHELAGHEFNIASLKQLRAVLFDELKLPVQGRTATGEPSTDQETLEALAPLHPLPRKIVEYRQVAKLKNTYVDALPEMVNADTGRVHTSFNQTVAATGRFSSSDPNLQNVPARTDQGREIRQAFLPRAGWRLLTADYSQVELRLLAHFCGDAALRRAFTEDKDVHASVAAEIFKVPEAEVTSAQRRVAKTVNFGVIYGISPHGLAVRLGISRDDAAQFIDDYLARFPAVQKYQEELLRQCARTGHVGTLLGRRRKINGVRPRPNLKSMNQAEREAVNMEIQGSAADLLKLAMLAIHRRLEREGFQARMLLTVHDELVFEAPPEEVERLAEMVRAEMVGAMTLEVPLAVDVAAGPNW